MRTFEIREESKELRIPDSISSPIGSFEEEIVTNRDPNSGREGIRTERALILAEVSSEKISASIEESNSVSSEEKDEVKI